MQNTPIFEENPPDKFKGIDIMRAVRSFDPCLPCGVHMYLGNGKSLQKMHSPMAVDPGHLTPCGRLAAWRPRGGGTGDRRRRRGA